jgi:NAD(P)-dependent dehydrogenase (short-subunit alcohol dehydrogenase family)
MNYLITGAGSGIGKAIAIYLANNDHTCFLMGRNETKLADTLSLLKGNGHQVFVGNVADENSVAKIVAQHPQLSIEGIIANAGVGGENFFGENDRWQEIINTNLTGTYLTVEHFLPALKNSKAPTKQVVIISSILARMGIANYTAYCASKAGLLGLMRSWAVQLAPNNILVNAICPGWVDTEMAQAGMQSYADGMGIAKTAFYDIAMQSVPLKKMSEPTEIANLVGYLLQQTSMTGQTIDINNGAIMNS